MKVKKIFGTEAHSLCSAYTVKGGKIPFLCTGQLFQVTIKGAICIGFSEN
jgi:hypothetical protein